ncbi:uncharacterized protein I303_100584 [Kwoniella dejecticola CBS 10117]|uniref:Ornithine cyclodeaminase n=1 Tax=Kwoniella dejecticola CBS 10117 TaxID=1296121 RepID=A0A1A6AFC3_9TREE|nr:uncharacterized protein I303_00587 [Kwoniella dejecticola CBS 10117]OBR88770.1 hypothetical protein I303_00587 [Kwoniella dejecticola CBS 10117]
MTSIRILTATAVDKVLTTLSPELALSSQAHVFKLFSNPSTPSVNAPKAHDVIQTPHRITVSSEETTMLFMPARAPTISTSASASTGSTSTTTSIKIVSVPQKSDGGLPGTTLILDEKSGKVKAVVNARKLTALRNAAGSALFLQQFPNPSPPQHLILFGSGAQCHSHALLFLELHPSLDEITFVVRSDTPRSSSVISELSSQYPKVNITAAVHPSSSSEGLDDLVGRGDIIVTATSSAEPLFKSNTNSPKKGSRVILIGSYKPTMHEIDTPLIKRAGLVVDSADACLRESGELIDAHIQKDDLVELGEVLNDDQQKAARKKQQVIDRAGESDGVIVFKSVGLGIQDVAITKLVLEEAERLNLGNIVEDYD